MTSVGDIQNNFEKLKTELRSIKYKIDLIDQDQMFEGLPIQFLPIMHYVVIDYSPEVAKYIREKGFELYGKSDFRFMELIYKLLVNNFNYKPALTKEKFFMNGFAERKIIFCVEVIQMIKQKHLALNKGSTGGSVMG